MRAYIVVDLGFGDAGKGLLTDFLVRSLRAEVIVRYNGGAQAGHNVVSPDGRHHTFSQFGSCMFVPNVRTYLSRHVVIHPTALLVEGNLLEQKGIQDPFARLRVSEQALIITPFHQAANRIREIVRGDQRHGSCGVGVGEAVEDASLYPENRVLAGNLNDSTLLRRKLRKVREQKRQQILELCGSTPVEPVVVHEFEVFERESILEEWISAVAQIGELGLVVTDSTLTRWMRDAENVVFEGAQGVLLDEDVGFHPYTTWSRCTSANALELIDQAAPDAATFQIGVMRSYMVRHGPGPLPTETDDLGTIIADHNQTNQWQGPVRYGWFDAVLARYALRAAGRLDSLLVTHLDVLPHLKRWNYCAGYRHHPGIQISPDAATRSEGLLTGFQLPRQLSLSERAQFTQALSQVEPLFESCEADERTVVEKIEALIEQPVGLISRGPKASDVEILHSLPS